MKGNNTKENWPFCLWSMPNYSNSYFPLLNLFNWCFIFGRVTWHFHITSYLRELCVFWWLFTNENTLWCLSWGIKTYPCSSSFLVETEVESIHSVCNCVTLHPLISIISSLNSTLNNDCFVSEVDLKPLPSVVVPCNPWTKSWATAHGI